jgi:hypothetical protein
MKATDPIVGKEAQKFIKTLKNNPEKGKHKLFKKKLKKFEKLERQK